MLLRSLAFCLGFIAAASTAAAQLDRRDSYGELHLSDRTTAVYWQEEGEKPGGAYNRALFVVIFRGSSGWQRDVSTDGAARRAYDLARADAARTGSLVIGPFIGRAGAWAVVDSGNTTVRVLEQRFPIPTTDSMRVVLVDRIDGVGGSPVVSASLVLDGRLPVNSHPEFFESGGASTAVVTRDHSGDVVAATLLRNATIAAFLRE